MSINLKVSHYKINSVFRHTIYVVQICRQLYIEKLFVIVSERGMLTSYQLDVPYK